MSKFNKTDTRAAATSPVRTEATPSGRTYEGGPGYERDAKSELFLLAVSNMVGESTFYESADDRDRRYAELIASVAVADPDWITRFLAWLRSGANLRSASVVGALEAARALKDAGIAGGRQIVAGAMRRADEPGEALAYWTSRHGRSIPKPVKRGVADAVAALYTPYALSKYDTPSHGFRFGDVIDLVHPTPDADKPWQGALFAHALDRRHQHDTEIDPSLPMLIAQRDLRRRAATDPTALFDTEALREAGMTWEDALSLAGPDVDKAALWEALIPSMGYMALLRNLRNFDKEGVSDAVAATVAKRLSDPEAVAASRQLPMRFLSAYKAAPSLRWGHALEKALEASLANVPELPGRALVLVDTSASMRAPFSRDGSLMRWDAAALFGIAVAARCEGCDVVSFSAAGWAGRDASKAFPLKGGESVLRSLDRWMNDGYFIGGGTETEAAVRRHYKRHDRVVILTDEQAHYGGGRDVTAAVPREVPVYTWNLAGYRYGHAPSGTGTRHTFGGLTDAGFRMIPLLDAGRTAGWPF